MKTTKYILYVLVLGLIFNINQFAQTTNEVNIKASDGTDLVKVKENGNVGIGIVDPTEKLEVDGNVKANNILSVATFNALLTNQTDFSTSSSFIETVLKYTNTQLNSNVDVFEITTEGKLKIKKKGTISVIASISSRSDVYHSSSLIYCNIYVNDSIIKVGYGHGAVNEWQFIENSINYSVNADDEISIKSIPGYINAISASPYFLTSNMLSVQWIGVDN